MRVYATELICSTGVLSFHTFKLALCIYNKLRSHAEILSWWAFDVTFPGSNPLRSNRSGLNVSNGRSWNSKFTLKVNSFWIKIKGQNFASQVLGRHTFKISRKKGSDFFDHRGTLSKILVQKLSRARETCYIFPGDVLFNLFNCSNSHANKRTKHFRSASTQRTRQRPFL